MADQLSVLTETIGIVLRRIQQIRDRKESIGEQNTKATLIEPVLAALGWNLQEIDEVRREYRRKPQDNPVDYALFLNRTECLFVEAKSLEKDLSDRKWISQNLAYATVAGVQWCVLTNGDEYRIYNAHAAVDVEDKLFRTVRISATEAKHVAETLILLSKDMMRGSRLDELWKAHFIDRNVRMALESLLSDEDGRLVRLIQKKAPGLTPADVRASLKRAVVRIDFPVPFAPPASEKTATFLRNREREKAGSRHEAGKKAWETMKAMSNATLENLIAAGIIKPPLEVERDYKGVRLTAVIEANAKVVFCGKAYSSLSTAAGMARKSVIGAPHGYPYPRTNGWQFWQYRDEDGRLQELDRARKRYLALTQQAAASPN
ncbi:MAG TPA: type I restriction endonuclease [Bryobacteraceae bacterium]|nr:type I restriction endonuclease [Bryobacteraceae bacterium]HPQ16650.1 type I restriction endonuclease [Bryobacteraceae bacterium]